MKNIIYIFAVSLVLSLVSCDPDRVCDNYKDIKNTSWARTEIVKFDVTIEDTTSYNKVFVNIRNTGNYKYSNLYLFMSTIYPNGKISRDTIDCLLANDKGKWLGKGLGDIKDCRYLLKKGVRFHQKGIYTFGFEQAMRIENLEGIKSIGIRIEKMK